MEVVRAEMDMSASIDVYRSKRALIFYDSPEFKPTEIANLEGVDHWLECAKQVNSIYRIFYAQNRDNKDAKSIPEFIESYYFDQEVRTTIYGYAKDISGKG